MPKTVGQAIDAARAQARQDPNQVRYPNEVDFMKRHALTSRQSEIQATRYQDLIKLWLAAGR